MRSKQLAREIDQREPDLIGLQEVALWRHGPLDGSPASVVDYDFLQTLLADLAARGERYHVINVQEESDVAGPAVLGGSLQNVRLTMRDVLLERARNGVTRARQRRRQLRRADPAHDRGADAVVHPRLQLGRRARRREAAALRQHAPRVAAVRRRLRAGGRAARRAGGAERQADDRRVRLQLRSARRRASSRARRTPTRTRTC